MQVAYFGIRVCTEVTDQRSCSHAHTRLLNHKRRLAVNHDVSPRVYGIE